jgi:hypothetical protein
MSESDTSRQATEVMALVKAIRPLLRGRAPEVQGATLADLLAMWLAGHVNANDPEDNDRIREQALQMHIEAVKGLIKLNYQMAVEPQLAACAACGAKHEIGRIRCRACGKPLVFPHGRPN